ncbi:hypothetical protein E1218_05295 [Kribbella turkmenica]|uniref:Lipopolysaccharide assembly protein A domain-containing protein n=1 Tax=Kribbella turkmenica TaxID=2530375 RepID=A0A4R4XEH2_9ACTN|nr:hypothetical protein [Kribbella turkmenica]TDD29143.1 hypothetical protein E1218_05295 [Kribbella turkmenica]
MAVLGIVLIILAVLFGLGVVATSTLSTTMEVFGVDFGVSVATVFVLGGLAGATLILGLWLTKKGLGRGYRRRKEIRELRAQAETTETTEDTKTAAVTESDVDRDAAPELSTDRDQPPADDHLATERPTADGSTETKQPH